VTVVIPAYNSARYVGQALDSVYAQTFRDYEVILVNDGSGDREQLEDVVRAHPQPIVYVSQENKGVAAARNAAIRIARGELYAQLDADDQWTPDYLQVQVKILSDNPEVALVYPNATIIVDDSDERLEFMKVSPSEGEVSFRSLVRQQCTVMTCVTARMDVIRGVGLFDESLRSVEDFDLWLRIVKTGRPVVYHRRELVLYRRHRGSLSSDRVLMLRNFLAVLEKAARTFDLTSEERETMSAAIAQNEATLYLFEGKRALSCGATQEALGHLQQANRHLRSSKLALAILLVRHLPRLATWSFDARERFLATRPGHLVAGIDEPSPSNPLRVGG
jgi:glycosyltransferase involved in cell wall biosynthesis